MYKIEELRKKNKEELLKLISELKGKLLALRFENSTGQLNEFHLIKNTKKDVAKVFTVLNEIENKKLTPSKEVKTNANNENKAVKSKEKEEGK